VISWISVVAIAVTTAALVVILSAMNGLTGVVADLYNAFEPDIRITAAKGKYIESDAIISGIRGVEGVENVSGTLSDKVLIRNMDNQALVTVKGVDQSFNRITNIESSVTEGVYALNERGPSIILGRGIANQLQVGLSIFGTELSVFSPARGKTSSLNPDDHLTQVYCTPKGIFSLNDELDFQYAFVNLETARRLFDKPSGLSSIEVGCAPGKSEQTQQLLREKLGADYVIKNRYQLNDTLFKSLETEKLATFIILAFILIIATFNIIGALTMLIIEKKRDIRTLFSMGADLRLIRHIFMREGLLITGIGATCGLIVGLFVCWLQIRFHLVKFGTDFIIPYYPIELQAGDFLKIFLLIMLIGFIAALYPVRVFTNKSLEFKIE
jgi:lipoprotein-releasing system permease protein